MVPLHALWRRLHVPRVVTAARVTTYVLEGAVGLIMLTMAPPSHGLLATIVGLLVAGLLVVGGVGGAGAAHCGLWGWERVWIRTLIVGYAALLPIIWPMIVGWTWQWKTIAAISIALAVLDHVGRHGLIQWAYIDPARKRPPPAT